MGFIYSIQICEISHQTFGPSHQKCLTCLKIFINTNPREADKCRTSIPYINHVMLSWYGHWSTCGTGQPVPGKGRPSYNRPSLLPSVRHLIQTMAYPMPSWSEIFQRHLWVLSPEYFCKSGPILVQLLMLWCLSSPCHQHSLYLLCRMNVSLLPLERIHAAH